MKQQFWAELFLKHWDANPDSIKDLAKDIDKIIEEFDKRFKEKT